MNKRYTRNIGTLSEEEQLKLAEKSACVIGCGGLGGGVIENLTRMGIGRLTVVDCDTFEETNLNRQVLSNQDNLGHAKAIEAKIQMKTINEDVEIFSIQARFEEDNAADIIRGHDVVIDALDSVPTRLVLEDACAAENIPLVHGAIDGWNGEVAVVMPGSQLLHEIYGSWEEDPTVKGSNPSFSPAVVSAIEAAEAIKLLLGKEYLDGKLLTIDLLNHEYEVIDF
ncbi:MAG: HesA/MoeB/ThiF family protein [Clostridia bacterium]|nr:HesA/MoeB/ThiF family protein [Clostridia bacterium]